MDVKPQIIELWRSIFGDPEDFISLFFEKKYHEENTLYIGEKNKVFSALQMLPYEMVFCGVDIPLSYICGALTDPEHRGRGYMKQLLIQAFSVMKQRNIPLSTLIPAEPWLFDFYRKVGYVSSFRYIRENYLVGERMPPAETPDFSKEEIYNYFSKKMRERLCCVLHSFEDFQTILSDHFMAAGKLVLLQRAGTISGLAFAVASREHVLIKELFYDSLPDKNQLICQAASLYNLNSVEIILPTVPEYDLSLEIHTLGMVRILDVHTLLKYYARTYCRQNFSLFISDDVIPENTGYYVITDGVCVRESFLSEPDLSCNIGTFSEALFGSEPLPLIKSQHPFMSLMLD